MARMEEELKGRINESKDKEDDSYLGGIVRNQVILMDTFGGEEEQPSIGLWAGETDQCFAPNWLMTRTLTKLPRSFLSFKFKPDPERRNEEAPNILSEQVNQPSSNNRQRGSSKKRGRPRSIKTPYKKKRRRFYEANAVPCPNCNKDLSYIKFQSNRNRHIKDCTTGSIYTCDLCKASFTRLHALQPCFQTSWRK
ncbi:hypothetical protein Ocin01_20141 [Orchesella cincta]|uniref:C2H2-type domain-containing protein n=1 Tax=Orchesella cincta TaxID=48709 RepID=A0A1D2M0Q3_ORCCI|nr:hypothetical protein Ocin01_20141 [Orchesella cincta]